MHLSACVHINCNLSALHHWLPSYLTLCALLPPLASAVPYLRYIERLDIGSGSVTAAAAGGGPFARGAAGQREAASHRRRGEQSAPPAGLRGHV